MVRIGLISDTHVPYRVKEIAPSVLRALRGVDLILHAGDVDAPWTLDVLREIAPVYAVRGNYHIFDGSDGGAWLPEIVELEIAGFHIVLTHGHHRGVQGIIWRVRNVLRNWRGLWDFPALDVAIVRTLLRRFPQADIIVFGHTHRPYMQFWGPTLVINPGAALPSVYFGTNFKPSLAHLLLSPFLAPQVEWFQEVLFERSQELGVKS